MVLEEHLAGYAQVVVVGMLAGRLTTQSVPRMSPHLDRGQHQQRRQRRDQHGVRDHTEKQPAGDGTGAGTAIASQLEFVGEAVAAALERQAGLSS